MLINSLAQGEIFVFFGLNDWGSGRMPLPCLGNEVESPQLMIVAGISWCM